MTRVSFIFGTRPEAIKLSPLILQMPNDMNPHICVTGQHREMLDQVLGVFGIVPDVDLNLMSPNQTLAEFASRAMVALDRYLQEYQPDLVLVQGDTSTVFLAALCSFYRHIPLGHVEAGLRTWNLESPWPEEANRVLTSRIASLHFAPTEKSRQNLLREGIRPDFVHMTGNTVIDALFLALDRVRHLPPEIPGLAPSVLLPDNGRGLVLITAHRRESFGDSFESICRAILALAQDFPSVDFVYPVHLNPNVREPAYRLLSGYDNIHLISPLPYPSFIRLMDRATLILTDSGGVQEEAPSLGKPVLVLRDTTERPEAVEAGTVRLVGTDSQRIIIEVRRLLLDDAEYTTMSSAHNPYGDGQASARIIQHCREYLFGDRGGQV